MIKNFLKKILSFAVLISMLFSSIGTVDTAYAADLSGITRSEWVSKLVSTFNMQVDDESNMPDNYFNDITSDMDCYKDILLAVEFGVIDLEAGQSFRPDDPATREFAAQTLNYCLGFKLDEGIAYTFNDSANVTYKDDAQVALNRGWFSLSNGKFCPEQAITESEMNTMLSDAVSVISGDAVSGTKNIFGVADGVIVVPETATVSIDNNGILTIGNYEGTLQTGDIFVVTLEGFPVAFQAVDVQQSDAGFIIETETNEDTDNAITSIQNEGTSDFDLEQFEVAEGATYRIVDESKGRSAGYETLSIEPYSIKYDKKSKKLTITESVKLNNVAAGTLAVAMKNIKIEQEINSGNQYAYVSMTADTDITASVKFNLSTYAGLPNTLPLGSINVGPAKLSVLMEYDLSGGMAASWSGSLQAGISYNNGNMRFLNSFHKDSFSMTAEVKLRTGIKAIAEFDFVMVKGSLWAGAGIKAGSSYKAYDTGTPNACVTIYGYLYVDTGYNVSVKVAGAKKSWNKTFEVYNQRNSPVRVVYHYEDNILVSSCSRDASAVPYLTSPHSRYFSSLPGYGSSSYNWGEESVATYSYKVETDSDTGKDYASITGYTGNPSVLAIPETLDGYTVKKIANFAFQRKTSLKAVTIPDTVTKIGWNAFDGCTSLASVKLSEKLKTIPSNAFQGCSSLASIKLPQNLNDICTDAFSGSGLESVTIPASCTTIDNYAFAKCKNLATVTFEQGVKKIGSYCFKGCTALENITIPDTVESIGSYAFYDCDTLRKVVIPNSVTNMGSYIFANCEKLSDVKLGTGLTAIPQYAFYECPALKSISIPYRITTIGTKAFANCTGLAEITIPQSVTSISSDAFSYPKNMTIYGVSGSKAETFANDKGINFVAKSISATNVSLNKTELTLKKGETATLVASIMPENFTDTISWRSTDTKVATVTDAGLVKGVAVGTAKIKVTVGGASALCTVNVIQPVTSISLNKTSLTMDALNTYQLTATAYPTTAVSRDIAWSSSDSSIASVDEKGLVTAHKKGTATIKATAKDGSNISNSCKVTVSNNGYEVSKVSEFESSHPYSNNCSDIWVYTVKGATYLDLVFDAKTNIEEDFDFLYIYDANGNLIGKYTGTSLAGKTIRVPGDTAKIKLISDEAGSTWGFRVTEVKTDAAEGGIKGDINGDGSITAADMQRLYNHLNGTALLKDASIADLNEDGSVTAADMQRLYNHLNGTALLK